VVRSLLFTPVRDFPRGSPLPKILNMFEIGCSLSGDSVWWRESFPISALVFFVVSFLPCWMDIPLVCGQISRVVTESVARVAPFLFLLPIRFSELAFSLVASPGRDPTFPPTSGGVSAASTVALPSQSSLFIKRRFQAGRVQTNFALISVFFSLADFLSLFLTISSVHPAPPQGVRSHSGVGVFLPSLFPFHDFPG